MASVKQQKWQQQQRHGATSRILHILLVALLVSHASLLFQPAWARVFAPDQQLLAATVNVTTNKETNVTTKNATMGVNYWGGHSRGGGCCYGGGGGWGHGGGGYGHGGGGYGHGGGGYGHGGGN